MIHYILFAVWKDSEGGARDFDSAYTDKESAMQAGLASWIVTEHRLSSWMHLAEFNPSEDTMKVIAKLNIPGTEYATSDKLEWIEVK